MRAKQGGLLNLSGWLVALLSLAASAEPAGADDCGGVVCRTKYVSGFQREYLEAMLFLPPTLATRPEKMVVYITRKKDGCVYVHSNYQARIRKETALLLERERLGQPLSELEKTVVEVFRGVSVRVDGEWRFLRPTKLVLAEPKEAAAVTIVTALVDTGDKLDPAEVKAIAEGVVGGSMKFLLSPGAADMDLTPAKSVEKVRFDKRQVGVVTAEKVIPAFQEDYDEALSRLGEATTTDLKKCAVFIALRKDGFFYVQTNYRPLMPDGKRAPFPAKLLTREKEVFFLLLNLAYPDSAPVPNDKKAKELFDAHLHDVRYLVTPEAKKALDFEEAGNVEVIK